MKYKIALTALALTMGMGIATQANASNFVEGKDYRVVKTPDKIKGDIIIVREFFWYGCPHCYDLEPIIKKWKAKKPKDVAFFSTPAAVNPVWENSARAFYASQLMGYQNKTHDKLFKDIFRDGKINRDIAGGNKEAIINWYASQGLNKAKFAKTMDSFAVNTKIARSNNGAKNYGLTGTPTVVVQGKYVLSVEPQKVPEAIDFLVNKVRKEIKNKKK
ncbi:MAG: thiol:disulfide interchange protein DsbA/DsbL [Moraxellaceae bacterium]|nr:thiol:disulfide interchange protein DsbA/DsbL [Moraxellaceae bacterium]